jgi:hypothetical protein
MEIVVAGKSSRVADAIPELNLKQLESLVERIVERLVGAPHKLKTLQEFADANAIGLTRVYQELNSGRLQGLKSGAKTVISPEAEAAWRASLPRYEPASVGASIQQRAHDKRSAITEDLESV